MMPTAGKKVKEIVNVMLDSVKGSLDNEEKACAGDAATKWRQWVQAAGLGGASQAHRWSRLPVQWRPHQVKVRGSGWSGSPWAILKDEAARKKRFGRVLKWTMKSGGFASRPHWKGHL